MSSSGTSPYWQDKQAQRTQINCLACDLTTEQKNLLFNTLGSVGKFKRTADWELLASCLVMINSTYDYHAFILKTSIYQLGFAFLHVNRGLEMS